MQTLVNQTTGRVLATVAWRTQSFATRLFGWIGKTIPANTALGITDCDWVHTFGVRSPLDIAFCDTAGIVLRVLCLSPCRIGPRIHGAFLVWEAAEGTFLPFLQPGDVLALLPAIPKDQR